MSNDRFCDLEDKSIKNSLESDSTVGYLDRKYNLNLSKSTGKLMVFYIIPIFLVLVLGYVLQTTVFDFDIYF